MAKGPITFGQRVKATPIDKPIFNEVSVQPQPAALSGKRSSILRQDIGPSGLWRTIKRTVLK